MQLNDERIFFVGMVCDPIRLIPGIGEKEETYDQNMRICICMRR